MFEGNTDRTWEYFGKNDPYFGVLTAQVFKKGEFTESARQEFFATGERYMGSIIGTIRQHFEPAFRPTRALDFGCGVGRLTLPLARCAESVVAVDVSESMMATAAENAKQLGISNITFLKSDDTLSRVTGRFDFVHSFIVFQHIPPTRGYQIFQRQIDMLNDDGIGALHFTYAYDEPVSFGRRFLTSAQHAVPAVRALTNLLKGRPMSEPIMQMNQYDVSRLLHQLEKSGCHEVHLRFTETSVHQRGFYGVILFFRKRALDIREHA
jgi:SAM-dependent methyltransferase